MWLGNVPIEGPIGGKGGTGGPITDVGVSNTCRNGVSVVSVSDVKHLVAQHVTSLGVNGTRSDVRYLGRKV